jgi:GTP-binding protein
VAEDGTFEGSIAGPSVYDETLIEEQQEQERTESGEYATTLTLNQTSDETPENSYVPSRPGHHFDLFEKFRFTIADNPGLIERASENVGLGHAFLRSMERSHVLVYVVDLSADAPWAELGVLREELEKYQPGMSEKGCIVVANKADLLASDGDPAEVEKAKTKLGELENYVKTKMVLQNGRRLDVIATAAKFSQNLNKVVALMQTYVQEARDRMDNGL